ncbi:MAG: sigma 54-interacting transcriptional regulator [Bacteroidota bacterium]
MREKILIVEDELIVATDLRMLLEKSGYIVCGIARSYHKAVELIAGVRPDIVLIDIFLKGTLTGIDLAKKLKDENIAFIYLSANSSEDILNAAKATQPYGFLVKPFREKDLVVTLEIARYRLEHSQNTQIRKEALFQSDLIAISKANLDYNDGLLKICKALQPLIPFDFIELSVKIFAQPAHYSISFLRLGFEEYQTIGIPELLQITGLKIDDISSLQSITQDDTIPAIYNELAFQQLCEKPSMKRLIAETFKTQSYLTLPLLLYTGEIFYLYFFSRRPDAYTIEHLTVFSRIQKFLLNIVESMQKEQKRMVGNKSANGVPGFRPESNGFEGIIGNSHLLLNVFDLVTQVATVDTSVLILGESGTGKEKIAEAIHSFSFRKKNTLIKINCAALPPTLIETELFGHEKGSFTGAIDKRMGKFEQANGGTIFLDEIAEIPLELQGKLLRVLQEKEIERIGGNVPIKIDVRIIAATNRNLEKEVAEGRFRLDLYYRLNVFPIQLPALRERKEDIPSLVNHFIQKSNIRSGRNITGISNKVKNMMEVHDWPGNIRELEYLIERAVLISKTQMIEDIDLPKSLKNHEIATSEIRVKTIEENERDHIITVLKKCKGRIWGNGGAAEILNVPPTTLNSKMKKLGIKKEY